MTLKLEREIQSVARRLPPDDPVAKIILGANERELLANASALALLLAREVRSSRGASP